MIQRVLLCLATCAVAGLLHPSRLESQESPRPTIALFDSLLHTGLRSRESFDLLRELTARAPHRLSGSRDAQIAVDLTKRFMEGSGFSNVRLEPCMVPHWVRGPVESAEIVAAGGQKGTLLAVCALGGSIATPLGGVAAKVVEVHSFDELSSLGDQARGKIVFFNRPVDQAVLNTFSGYSGAVDQRASGGVMAAKAGGVAALVRSASTGLDNVPHTGGMGYQDSVRKVPGAAVSTVGADLLSSMLKKNPDLRVRLILTCRTLPDAPSANVVGEITGSEKPDEVVVVSGHLDCWDKGSGAHDDGAGCVQAIEALRLLKSVGVKPKRTIRAVMFMNEENGTRGGNAYVTDPGRKSEKHVALIESDRGGFAPRGFDVQADSTVVSSVLRWRELFDRYDAGRIRAGGSGTDVSPMATTGVPAFGLVVENQRYFDYHHSDNDTIDKVNPRELELGAVVEAMLCYLISEEGFR